MRHGLPLGDAPSELRIALVTDKGPGLFEIVAVVVGGVRATLLDQRLSVVQVAVDGLNGIIDAAFLCVVKGVSDEQHGCM